MSCKLLFNKNLVLYNNSQIPWADFHISQFVPVELTQFIHEVLFAIYLNILFITSWVLPEKSALFWPLTSTNHLILSVQKPRYLNRPKSKCKLSKFTKVQVWLICHVKVSQLQKKYRSKTTNHSPQTWPFELHFKKCIFAGSFFCSQTHCLAMSDPVCSMKHFSVLNIVYIYSLLIHKLK